MLTGLKVSSLVWKCLFYRLELTEKWGPYGTETFEKSRAQTVDEKNWVIPLVMFTLK